MKYLDSETCVFVYPVNGPRCGVPFGYHSTDKYASRHTFVPPLNVKPLCEGSPSCEDVCLEGKNVCLWHAPAPIAPTDELVNKCTCGLRPEQCICTRAAPDAIVRVGVTHRHLTCEPPANPARVRVDEDVDYVCAKCGRDCDGGLECPGGKTVERALRKIAATSDLEGLAKREAGTPTFKKFDTGKVQMDLIAPHFEKAMAEAMTVGADKYGRGNYLNGFEWHRYLCALKRHVNAWHRGEQNDPEDGIPHLAHAAACCMILAEAERLKIGKDDRAETNGSEHAKV